MKPNRIAVMSAVALVVLALSGAAGLLASTVSNVPALPARPSLVPPLLAKQAIQVRDCAGQNDNDADEDDDKTEVKKPDTDNIELQCGHQDNDDNEIEDGPAKHHEGREQGKKAERHDTAHKAADPAKAAMRK